MRRAVIFAALLAALTIAACGSEDEAPAVAAPPTPLPTAAPVEPTATPAPAAEPAPTPAPAPTATPQPIPTPPVVPFPAPTAVPTPSLAEVLRYAEGAVVQVRASSATGSGFVFDQLGYVLTADHVVGADASVIVTYADGTEERALVIGRDEVRDLAVLKVSGGSHLRPLPLGHLDDITKGDRIVTLGFTGFNEATTSTEGIVSEILRHDEEQYTYLQTDATFHTGQSGGPVINSSGEVVGVISRAPSSASPLVTLGWAIAMDDYGRQLVERLQQGEVTLTPDPPGIGHSYRMPAPLNYPVRVLSRYFNGAPLAHDITVLRVVRGEPAWAIVKDAYQFNLPPGPNFEFMLAWIRIDYARGPEGHTDWVSQSDFGMLSHDGRDYVLPLSTRPPQPFLSARLYPGSRIEAWTVWLVRKDDPAPLLVFGLDSFYRAGKAYFTLALEPQTEAEDGGGSGGG